MDLLRQAVSLNAGGSFVSPEIAIDPETSALLLTFTRGASYDIHIAIVVDDGIGIYKCETDDTGGVQKDRDGNVIPATYLLWNLPTGFFGRRSGFRSRLGEGKNRYNAHVEVQCLRGSFASTLLLTSDIVPTEKIEFEEYQRLRAP